MGDNIYLNEKYLLDEKGKVDFIKILNTLFHEAAHVTQHRKGQENLDRVFGKTHQYKMSDKISQDVYRLQDVESHSNYMGGIAELITKDWNNGQKM